MVQRLVILVWVVVVSLASAAPSTAQDDIYARDLSNPRHIAFDSAGNLYVAEAGSGGSTLVPGFGSVSAFGGTGQVSIIDETRRPEILLGNLASVQQGARGPMGIIVTDDLLWVALGEADTPRLPFTSAVIGVDRETLRVRHYIDLYTPEATLNPDGDVVASNPSDLALGLDGTLYIADASANTVWQWTAADGVRVFVTWTRDDNPVPTAVEVGPEGHVYISFLTGVPFPTEGSRIERYSPDGTLVDTVTGLTTVVDLAFGQDGHLYAVEFSNGMTGGRLNANSGRVVRVEVDGLVPVAEGLDFPYGLAQNAEGGWVVAVGSNNGKGQGLILQLDF